MFYKYRVDTHTHILNLHFLLNVLKFFLNLQRLVWTPKLKFLLFICARLRSGSFVTFYTIINVVRRTHITVSIKVFLKQGELLCTSSIFHENLICWWDIWLWSNWELTSPVSCSIVIIWHLKNTQCILSVFWGDKTFLPFARASHFELSCTNLKLRPCFFSKSFSTVNHQVGSEPGKAQINISPPRKLQPVGNSLFTKVVGKLLAVLCASFFHFWRESSEAVQPVGGQVTTRGNSGRLFVGRLLEALWSSSPD